MSTIKTVPQMLASSVEKFSNNTALSRKESGKWVSITYAELGKKALGFAKALHSLGLGKGDRIALMLPNGPEWVLCDLAALSLGAADAPLYGTLAPDQAKHIINDSGSKIVVVAEEDQAAKLREIIGDLPGVETVITVEEGIEPFGNKKTLSFSAAQKIGDEAGDDAERAVKEASDAVSEDDLASIIYTSGTTGLPKGVMLSHGNFMSNVTAVLEVLELFDTDKHLSFLPLSHVFERTCGYYGFFTAGLSIYYAESIEKIGDNIREISPTVVVSVPRLFEKMIGKIKGKVADAPAIRQKLFYWALDVGGKMNDPDNKDKGLFLAIQAAIAKKLVFGKLHKAFGGSIRFFVSGGAALSKDVFLFFRAIGIKVTEGYGLTETSPVICFNPLEDIRAGTVGKVLSNVEVKIENDGELCVKGPSITKGYYNNPEATKEAFDNEGWFHTGDIGEISDDGYIKITDRKKDILVMSNGKNVAPQPIESKLVGDDFIAQVVVIGNNLNFITALIVPDFERLKKTGAELGISGGLDDKGLAKDDLVKAFFERKIEELNKNFARFEAIKKFTLLPQEFTIEGGELTPTMKIKRKVVLKKYEKEIEAMYAAPIAPDPA